jgi:hypothetical protein
MIPLKETRMNAPRLVGCLALLAGMLVQAQTNEPLLKSDVHWCEAIPSFAVLQEATFTAIYTFDLNSHGRPVQIQRVSVPLISKADAPLVACIESWHLPKSRSKGTAAFTYHWGWTDLKVTSGDFNVTRPAHSSNPDSR